MGERDMDATNPGPWHPARCAGLRLGLVYFLLYTFPFPLGHLPGIGEEISGAVSSAWKVVAPWVGENLLGIEEEIYVGRTGSGDTTLAYLQLFVSGVLAALVAGVWSLIDRRPRRYERLARWLVVGVRYYLATVMLGYGLAKVVPTQFLRPDLTRLLTTYGESSPMGIVWTFMGLSPAYTVFSGLAETVGGALLLSRRATSLGAFVVAAVMTNVAMLNYAYDVPVKLYSSHLLAMALALLTADARRLVRVLVLGRAVPARPPAALFPWRWAGVLGKLAGVALLGHVGFTTVERSLSVHRDFGNARPRPEIWGIHDVTSFVLGGEERPPLLTDEVRWRALVVDRALPAEIGDYSFPGRIAVWRMDGTFEYHSVELDEEADTLSVLPPNAGAQEGDEEASPADVLRYEREDGGELVLRGTWKGEALEVRTRERDLSTMELIGRGFRWIQELPYNR